MEENGGREHWFTRTLTKMLIYLLRVVTVITVDRSHVQAMQMNGYIYCIYIVYILYIFCVAAHVGEINLI